MKKIARNRSSNKTLNSSNKLIFYIVSKKNITTKALTNIEIF